MRIWLYIVSEITYIKSWSFNLVPNNSWRSLQISDGHFFKVLILASDEADIEQPPLPPLRRSFVFKRRKDKNGRGLGCHVCQTTPTYATRGKGGGEGGGAFLPTLVISVNGRKENLGGGGKGRSVCYCVCVYEWRVFVCQIVCMFLYVCAYVSISVCICACLFAWLFLSICMFICLSRVCVCVCAYVCAGAHFIETEYILIFLLKTKYKRRHYATNMNNEMTNCNF